MLCAKAVVIGLFAVVLSAVVSSRASAALPIEFEFSGVFTNITFPGSVHQVGDPFTTTVRFDPATPDLNPVTFRGRYTYTSWVAPSPFAQPYVFNPTSGDGNEILILSGNSEEENHWLIRYFGANNFGYAIDVRYPVDTFSTDALPVTLDLSTATVKRFGGGNATSGGVFGDITSLTVRQLPEPVTFSVGASLAFLAACLRPRRRAAVR